MQQACAASLYVETASGLQNFSQLQQAVVRRLCKELLNPVEVPGICKTDVKAGRLVTQAAVEGHAHRQVAGAANAAGGDACNIDEVVGGDFKRRAAVWQSLEDECDGSRVFVGFLNRTGDCRLACRSAGARNERGEGRGGLQPFLDNLPGSTPSCLSLRYRCVRSSPVLSATRVMLPPSRARWCSK